MSTALSRAITVTQSVQTGSSFPFFMSPIKPNRITPGIISSLGKL